MLVGARGGVVLLVFVYLVDWKFRYSWALVVIGRFIGLKFFGLRIQVIDRDIPQRVVGGLLLTWQLPSGEYVFSHRTFGES